MDNERKNLEQETIDVVFAAYGNYVEALNNEIALDNPNQGRFKWLEVLLDILIDLFEIGNRQFSQEDQPEITNLIVLFALVHYNHHLFF
uniref:Uncharacterized protein n=1 Tax=Caenorhabditis tropicalis TaxID=1561998 RepID=A0A1I7UF04_9PELO